MESLVRQWRRKKRLIAFPRWGGGSIAAVVVLLLSVLLGYGYLYARMGGAQPARGPVELDALCGSPPVYVAANSPYRGPGPHPMVVYHEKDQTSPPAWTRVAVDPSADDGAPLAQEDSAQVQLVACAERVQEERTREVCRLEGGATPLYRAVYRVRVREARTARTVAETLVRPTAEQCPRFIHVDSRDPRAYTLPSAQDYAQQLADVMNAPAAGPPARVPCREPSGDSSSGPPAPERTCPPLRRPR
ncbi:hypothetical protein ACIP6P_12285 [Streptomyces sp. NPDC088729]|uniref:hypothetical protein n=1 Tax=Streptomyces sp. NPDC088729 TaxID=3365876 RepID=UPI003814A536